MAVFNATAPLFAALLAHFIFHERLGRWRSAGLVIGFGGVALLTAGSVSFRSTTACWRSARCWRRRRCGPSAPTSRAVGSVAWTTWR